MLTLSPELRENGRTSLEACITDVRCTWSTFYRQLYVLHQVEDVLGVRFEGGLTLLQVIVLHGRWDLLRALQYLGLWARLRSELTLEDLANPDALQEILPIDEDEGRLTDLEKLARSADEDGLRSRAPACSLHNHRLLFYACQSGSLNMVLSVLEEHRQGNVPRTSVDDELRIAVRLGHAHLLTVLCKTTNVEVDLNLLHLDNKPLIHQAAVFGYWDVLDVLLELGVRSSPYTLLLAASHGHGHFIRNLLRLPSELDINHVDKRHKTALMFAVEKGHRDVVELLLEHGADMTIADCRGHNVLHACSANTDTHILDLLVSAASKAYLLHQLLKVA